MTSPNDRYNITWLVMRNLCGQLLDIEVDSDVLQATNGGSGPHALGAELTSRSNAARADIRRLNILYDSVGETDHGGNSGPQSQWDGMFKYVTQNRQSDISTLLMISGGTPSGF